MSTTRTAVTGESARIASGGAIIGAALLLAATIAGFCVEAVAANTSDPPAPVAGRWVAEKRNVTLDLQQCGNGWCGVEVTEGNRCGRIALRFELVPRSDSFPRTALMGRLELASEPRAYAVELNFLPQNEGNPPRLHISGNIGDKFEPWRRTFPFTEMLVRRGDATCAPAAKVS